jgi:hypothetical protein
MADPKTRTLVGTVKDEGPYLLEWICYYRLIGFDHLVIASNDCTDGTREILDYLDDAGLITHLENSEQDAGRPADPQNRAYQRIWDRSDVRHSEWVLVADADEFLNIHVGDGTLDALFAALEGRPDLISVPWQVFGNSGIVQFVDEPVIGQFTKAAARAVHRIQRYSAFKTMFRPRVVKRLGIHRPKLAPRFRNQERPLLWVNGSGAPLPERYLTQGWRFFEESYGAGLVSMNHYMIKSSEAFLMKRYRGTANSADEDRIDFSYFETFNANAVTEAGIQRHFPALSAAINTLKAQHPQLAELHDDGIAYHLKKLATAREDIVRTMPDVAARLALL